MAEKRKSRAPRKPSGGDRDGRRSGNSSSGGGGAPRSSGDSRGGSGKKPSCPVTAYARAVVSGKIVAGKLARLSCQRHLSDLKSGTRRGLIWDGDAALHAIEFSSDASRAPIVPR